MKSCTLPQVWGGPLREKWLFSALQSLSILCKVSTCYGSCIGCCSVQLTWWWVMCSSCFCFISYVFPYHFIYICDVSICAFTPLLEEHRINSKGYELPRQSVPYLAGKASGF